MWSKKYLRHKETLKKRKKKKKEEEEDQPRWEHGKSVCYSTKSIFQKKKSKYTTMKLTSQ